MSFAYQTKTSKKYFGKNDYGAVHANCNQLKCHKIVSLFQVTQVDNIISPALNKFDIYSHQATTSPSLLDIY